MKRVFRLSCAAVLVLVGAAASASAQTAPASSDLGYVEFTFGPTFGDTSSASVGAEGGYFFTRMIGVFAEGGQVRNAAGTDIQNRAGTIARVIGGTATTKQPVNYFDAGAIVRVPTGGMLEPYFLFGIGMASVSNNVTFSVNGNDVTSSLLSSYGVQLGGDLSGDYSHAFVTVGVGAHVAIGSRLLADVSYRFGQVGKHADTEQPALKTNRLQFGAGVRF